MPKLWSDTIDAHRNAVRDATLNATASLVAEHGLTAVTMSQIAKRAGIGRATLYKYFPDIEAILLAWHERHITSHLQKLTEIRTHPSDPGKQLEAVLQAFAAITHQSHDTELGALLHRAEHVTHAEQHLHELIRDLVTESAKLGVVRSDVPPDELATFCLHALSSASGLPTKAAVRRLVAVTLGALRPEHPPSAR